MTEKDIIAYFKTPEDAESVEKKLLAMRAVDTTIERLGSGSGEWSIAAMGAMTVNFSSMANLTMGASPATSGPGILLATDSSISDMRDSDREDTVDRDVRLTAIVDERMHEQAMRVIEEGGGRIE